MDRFDEIKETELTGRNRLINIYSLHQAAREQLCKICVVAKIENERETIVDVISNHLVNKKGFTAKQGLIREFTVLLKKKNRRRTNKILDMTQIKTIDNYVSLGSTTTMKCCNDHNNIISLKKLTLAKGITVF